MIFTRLEAFARILTWKMQISLLASDYEAANELMHSSQENGRLVHGKRLFYTAPSPIGRNELNLCQGRVEVNKKKTRKPKTPGARQNTRGRFLSLSFRSSNPQHPQYSRIPRRSRAPTLFQVFILVYVGTWHWYRGSRVLIKFGTRHRGVVFRISCTPVSWAGNSWLSF